MTVPAKTPFALEKRRGIELDVKKDTWDKAFEHIVSLITSEYRRHWVLAGSERIADKEYYAQVIEGTVNRDLFDTSLYMLSKMLHKHYGIAPIIIIDEYDTPIQQGHMRGYYDEVVRFMSNLFSGCLKDNRHLSYGFLTGILRAAKESIFSGEYIYEVTLEVSDQSNAPLFAGL